MAYAQDLSKLSRRGDIQVCLQCDGISTGVADPKGQGFVLCGGCRRKNDLRFGADPTHPGTGQRTKSARQQRARIIERFRHLAIRAAQHYRIGTEGYTPDAANTYTRELAERLVGSAFYA